MKLSTRSRVVKSNAVEVCVPRLVENAPGGFQLLGEHISVVRDTSQTLSLVKKENSEVLWTELEERSEELPPPKVEGREGSALCDEAKGQAEEILAQAHAEAQRIREEARAEIEAIKAQVREEVSQQAYQEGYAQGKAQGYAEGKAQGISEADEIKKEARQLLQMAQRALTEQFNKVDVSLLHLAIKIAERILHARLGLQPEYLLDRIRALTLLPQEKEGWRLYVSPQDAEWLVHLTANEQLDIPLCEDETLKPGDCYLECPEGVFDARLEAQLEQFEKLLGEEIKYDGLDQAGR